MKRSTTIAVLFIALLAISGVMVGASGFDNLFEDSDTDVADEEIQLSAVESAADADYVGFDDDDIELFVENMTGESEVTIDEVFNATYNGNKEGSIYFEPQDANVEIIDSDGEVIDSDERVNFTANGETSTFGVRVTDTSDADAQSTVDVVSEVAVDTTFTGSVSDTAGIDAPEGTDINAEVDGEQVASTTVDENNEYELDLEVYEDDDVEFIVGDTDASTTYSVQSSDVGGTVSEDLVFDGDVFGLQVLNFDVDPDEVDADEEITVSADLEHNGTVDLDRTVEFSVDESSEEDREVTVGPDETEDVSFTYDVENENVTVEISTGDYSVDQVVEVEERSSPKPVSFTGDVTDDAADPVTAPEGTEIYATVVGTDESNTTTVDEDGVYGGDGFGDDDLTLNAEEGDEIAFYVRNADGPAHLENNFTVEEDDFDGLAEEDLVFPEATFDLQVLDFSTNATDNEVDQGDVIEVSANLTNNGSTTLEQDANLTIDSDDVVQTKENESVAGGESKEVVFDYEVDQAQNFTIGISTDDDSAEQQLEVLSNIVFFGDVTDGTTAAPEDTVIATTINEEPAGTGTVNETGQYSLGLSVEEGDDVEFFVRDTEGPVPRNVDEYSIDENDISENIEQELVFEAGTFDLNVLDISADPQEVQPGEEVEVDANLDNNGGVALSQNVTFEIDGETVETNESFTVEDGEQKPISFTHTPTTSDDFTANISSEDDTDLVEITVDGITNVEDGTFDNDFAGTVLDDGDLTLTASNVQNDSGNFDGSVPIQLNTSAETSVEIGEIDVTDGEIEAEIDPEADIPVDVDLGDATIEVAGVQTDATVTVIHEAQSFGDGSHVTSAPQGAQLYAEGTFSTTQWDDEEETFSSAAIDSDGTFTDSTNVHRGLYVLTNDDDFRFGWEYQESDFDDGYTADLSENWNLVSSNYNISDGQISVEGDLALDTDISNVDVYDANTGELITDTTVDSGEYDAYWVFTGSNGDVTRTLDVSAYSASDRAES